MAGLVKHVKLQPISDERGDVVSQVALGSTDVEAKHKRILKHFEWCINRTVHRDDRSNQRACKVARR